MQAIGRQPQRAPDGAPVHYQRHRPEQTTLYRLVQQPTATFIAEKEVATMADLPQFFKDEFSALLECGILAHGFLELRSGECGHDKLMAFSRKRWGSVTSPVESMQQLAALGPADNRSGRRGGRRACPGRPGAHCRTGCWGCGGMARNMRRG